MVVIAIANGAVRDLWYGPRVGELRAHQISTLTAGVLLGVYIWFAVRFLRPNSFGNAVSVGVVWLGMTVAFEFLFGHYVVGMSWVQLVGNYNLLAGHLWPLILVLVCVAPPLFYRLQREDDTRIKNHN